MYHVGKIIRKQKASPTVVVLELKVPSLSTFLPGQWVDFMVPNYSWIGGFSIASGPRDLPNVTLAVKRSNHAPATWVHEESQVDQEVHVQVGGTFVLPPIASTESPSSAFEFLSSPPRIFCAGGIGISPVLSQYREFLQQRESCAGAIPNTPGPPARFLYTVSEQSELVFAEELVKLATLKSRHPGDCMVFVQTKASKRDNNSDCDCDGRTMYPQGVELKSGRGVMKPFLDEAPKESIFHLCGPPGMLDDAVAHLTVVRGVDQANIQYEKWW